MDENPEGGRVLAHCESYLADPNCPHPRPFQDPWSQSLSPACTLGPSFLQIRGRKTTFVERLVLAGHFSCMMSQNPHCSLSGKYYCWCHFTREEAEIQKNQRTAQSHKSREL